MKSKSPLLPNAHVCVCVQESLEKQTQYAQTLSEKLWHAERQLEELEIDKDSKDKKRSELTSTILRLETEVLSLTTVLRAQ